MENRRRRKFIITTFKLFFQFISDTCSFGGFMNLNRCIGGYGIFVSGYGEFTRVQIIQSVNKVLDHDSSLWAEVGLKLVFLLLFIMLPSVFFLPFRIRIFILVLWWLKLILI
ncbi:hypothetical protein WICPIJ_004409 [Wickerhamomyces pijperi]|uniref:Transmembrane protein n=1 Tax=Wickerhamomyces pijperi TaxID=599730 RepID=A0A9P8TNB4_WICPI|nr:hypothetical protein WICPIJ_004409 [Wickerhamomyces pijperi]